ncbi:hypothetical protein HNQ92_005758 [Rhabdobacter roseus]|uniref:Uncharacterized protein n=1 Tax=Rhabdobacter roseus TaxID=1655419 RepID=A0A840U118_9BACT|nr:hypothetical protein [Rhabdobacter roseus]
MEENQEIKEYFDYYLAKNKKPSVASNTSQRSV